MGIDLHACFDAATCVRLNQRLAEVMNDIRNYGIRQHKSRQVLTGYSYGEFYDWDLYFENLFLTYYGISDYNRNGVEMFLDQQLECGFVSRTMGVAWQKPRHHNFSTNPARVFPMQFSWRHSGLLALASAVR